MFPVTGGFEMASDSPARASAARRLFLLGLLAVGGRAEPMLRTPDYVTDHGGWPADVIRWTWTSDQRFSSADGVAAPRGPVHA